MLFGAVQLGAVEKLHENNHGALPPGTADAISEGVNIANVTDEMFDGKSTL